MAIITNKSNVTSNYLTPDAVSHESRVDSNEISITNVAGQLTKDRSSSSNYGAPREELLQSLLLSNEGNSQITNIHITDTITEGATFKEGTLTIDGVKIENGDPTVGFDLGKAIDVGGSANISYTIVIDDKPALTTVNTISNVTYTADGENYNENSNRVVITIVNQNISIVKTTNKSAVLRGDTLMFQNVIKNEGEFENTDVSFIDEMPAGAEFVAGTVKINDVSQPTYNPAVGFTIQDLQPNDEVTITFDVKVL